MGFVLNNVAAVAQKRGDPEAAERAYRESARASPPLGRLDQMAFTLTSLGRVAAERGDQTRAQALLEEGIGVLRGRGSRFWLALRSISLAWSCRGARRSCGRLRLFGKSLASAATSAIGKGMPSAGRYVAQSDRAGATGPGRRLLAAAATRHDADPLLAEGNSRGRAGVRGRAWRPRRRDLRGGVDRGHALYRAGSRLVARTVRARRSVPPHPRWRGAGGHSAAPRPRSHPPRAGDSRTAHPTLHRPRDRGQLFISPKTAGHHVSNILGKLGAATGARPPPSPPATPWSEAGYRLSAISYQLSGIRHGSDVGWRMNDGQRPATQSR